MDFFVKLQAERAAIDETRGKASAGSDRREEPAQKLTKNKAATGESGR